MPGRRKVEDGKPAMPQRQPGARIGPYAITVGAATIKSRGHAFRPRQKVRFQRAPGEVNETGKTTHTVFS